MAVRVSKADFEEKVLKEAFPVLVDFYSDSCVVCKKLAPVLGNAEDAYEDLLTGSLLTFDALTMEFHKIKLPKDTHKCPVCGDNPTILEPIDYEQEVCEETAGRFATRDEQ